MKKSELNILRILTVLMFVACISIAMPTTKAKYATTKTYTVNIQTVAPIEKPDEEKYQIVSFGHRYSTSTGQSMTKGSGTISQGEKDSGWYAFVLKGGNGMTTSGDVVSGLVYLNANQKFYTFIGSAGSRYIAGRANMNLLISAGDGATGGGAATTLAISSTAQERDAQIIATAAGGAAANREQTIGTRDSYVIFGPTTGNVLTNGLGLADIGGWYNGTGSRQGGGGYIAGNGKNGSSAVTANFNDYPVYQLKQEEIPKIFNSAKITYNETYTTTQSGGFLLLAYVGDNINISDYSDGTWISFATS